MDFDNDGNTDILSGSWPGELYFFRRLNDGSFERGKQIEDRDGEPIKLGSAAAVFAADWDADQDLDLLVGTIEGHVHLVTNEGAPGKAEFGEARRLKADGREIEVPHGDAGPAVADWDGDGQIDLVVGSGDGSVLWFRNEGSTGEPKLAKAATLLEKSSYQFGERGKEEGCGMRTKVCVADYDADGRPDLLVGDFLLASADRPELTEEEQAAAERAQEKLQSLLQQLAELQQSEDPFAEGDDEDQAVEEEEATEEATETEESEAEDESDESADEEEIEEEASDVESADDFLSGLPAKQRKLFEEIQAAQQEYAKYQPTDYTYHGYVWLLRRQTPTAQGGGK